MKISSLDLLHLRISTRRNDCPKTSITPKQIDDGKPDFKYFLCWRQKYFLALRLRNDKFIAHGSVWLLKIYGQRVMISRIEVRVFKDKKRNSLYRIITPNLIQALTRSHKKDARTMSKIRRKLITDSLRDAPGLT